MNKTPAKALLGEPTEAIQTAIRELEALCAAVVLVGRGDLRNPIETDILQPLKGAYEALRSSTPQEPVVDDAVNALLAAIDWLERPFVDDDTTFAELKKRVRFCVADKDRVLTRLQAKAPETGEADASD